MIRNNLISAPIKFPVIQPDNWDEWWDLWYKEAVHIPKTVTNHNTSGIFQAFWRGFDIYVKEGFDAKHYGYDAKNMNCSHMFSSLFDNLDDFPMDINVMRVISSMHRVSPHSDSTSVLTGIRTLLYDNNIKPNFYYVFGDRKEYQRLPQDTNTWMYNDHKSMHGTDFYPGHSKLLIAYYGKIKDDVLDKNLEENLSSYSEYAIYDSP